MKHFVQFPLQGPHGRGMSCRGHEISKDLQLFTEDEQVNSEATESWVIQQQEQEQILWDFQILWALFPKYLAVILQVGNTSVIYTHNFH